MYQWKDVQPAHSTYFVDPVPAWDGDLPREVKIKWLKKKQRDQPNVTRVTLNLGLEGENLKMESWGSFFVEH